MANKIFYWLKFKNDFFSSLRIKKLRKDYGDTCLVIYLKLQLFALETDGVLEYKGVFPTFAEEMAEEIGEDPEKVKDTIDYLISCGLMEQNENTYILPFVKENTGDVVLRPAFLKKENSGEKPEEGEEFYPTM